MLKRLLEVLLIMFSIEVFIFIPYYVGKIVLVDIYEIEEPFGEPVYWMYGILILAGIFGVLLCMYKLLKYIITGK